MRTDYYLVLGVPPQANQSQLRRAFRRLTLQYHPDRAGDAGVERFLQIKEAYDALMDAQRRAEHDRQRQQAASANRLSPIMHEPIDLFSAFESYRPSSEIILDRWLSNFTGRVPKSHPPRELNLELVLSPDEAARGGRVPIDVPVAMICPTCDGSGVAGLFTCDTCGGHGVNWDRRRIEVPLRPPVQDGTVIPISLHQVGVSTLYLNVHLRVAGLM